MYSLVKFVEDDIYYVTPSKGTTVIEGTLVWAPYKRMGFYEANVIATNNDKLILIQLMQEKENEQVTNVNIEGKVTVPQEELTNKAKSTGNIRKPKLKRVGDEKIRKKIKIHQMESINPSTCNEQVGNETLGEIEPPQSQSMEEFNSQKKFIDISFDSRSTSLNNDNSEKNVSRQYTEIVTPGKFDNETQSEIEPPEDKVTNVNIKGKVTVPQKELKNKAKSTSNIRKPKLKRVGDEKINKKIKIHQLQSINPSTCNEQGTVIHEFGNETIGEIEPLQSQSMEESNSQDNFIDISFDSRSISLNSDNSEKYVSRQFTAQNISRQEVKKNHKRHCCLYCKKKIFQIVRHWTKVHKEENEVQSISKLHAANPLRRKKIDDLRRKGDYEFNKSCSSSDLIVSRKSKKQKAIFVPCPSCLGYFSKSNLRHHVQKCCPEKGSRQLQGNSRKLTYHIHEKASDTLRNIITPDMFHDEVTNLVFFDELLVIYGNYLCIKYTEEHLKNHIRAQLRLLGRFMLRVKVHDPNIANCKQLIDSKNIETVRKAVDDIGAINPSTNIYEHPTNARTLLIELRKLIQVVKSESDKTDDEILMKKAKAFSRRVKQELAPYINRICKNSENKLKRAKRQKDNILPENEDIGKYLDYLQKNIYLAEKQLKKKFSVPVWTELSQYLMVYLAVFNRKRPGETQRIEVSDFQNRECINPKDVDQLDEFEKIQADKYERIGFRGKLGNSTALLIDKTKILPGLNLIVKYRDRAGVNSANRFLFAKPSKTEKNLTFDAYRCHTYFCQIAGINHENLTFTKLRKHLATEIAKTNLSQEDERRVSTYMSHDYNIHKRIYDQSATLVDITKVSQHLEDTMQQRKKKNTNVTGFEQSRVVEASDIEHWEREKDENREKSTYKNCNDKNSKQNKSKELNNLRMESKYGNKEYQRLFAEDFSPTTDSDSSNSEPTLREVERCLGKFRKRNLWTTLEKQTTRQFFQMEILENRCIDNEKVRKFKELFKKEMVDRSVPMIKQWIKKEMIKVEKQKCGVVDKRPRYSTPEKNLLESSLERHSMEGSEPSFQELEDLIAKHDVFQNRTADSLHRKFKHMSKKRK